MRRTIDDRLQMRSFKMGVVLPLVHLSPQERSIMIKELITKKMEIPGSKRKTLSRSIIYQWIKEFKESTDMDTLFMTKERSDKGTFPSLTTDQKEALLVWRGENPYRTVKDLRDELFEHTSTCVPSVPSESVIARFLRESGYSRKNMIQMQDPQKVRLPFEAEYPMKIWQMDTKGKFVKIMDPADPQNEVEAKLIVIIDDYSRYVVMARYVIKEDTAAVVNLFRMAITMYGIPEVLYTDKGSPYIGHMLLEGAPIIGCRVQSTPAGDASAKGKIEKSMQNFTNRLESEIKLLPHTPSLQEMNEYVQSYTEQDYNLRIHSTTGETPEARFGRLTFEYRRFISEEILSLIFLENKEAKVSKDGQIRFKKNSYLVPHVDLYDKKVTIRYQEDDLSRIFVWYKDQYINEAHLHVPDNDFQKRMEFQENMGSFTTPTPLPITEDIPKYSRLQRFLLAQRQAVEEACTNLPESVNLQLDICNTRKKELKQELKRKMTSQSAIYFDEFTGDAFQFLVSALFKRELSANERNLIALIWHKKGPFTREMVESAVGELLGKNHPTTDLKAYLENIHKKTTES